MRTAISNSTMTVVARLPNKALEPTPPASARASLRLLARLSAGVRHECHLSGKQKTQPCRAHLLEF
jgi:hypothetical protein